MVTFSGCYTALITPMNRNRQVDYEGLQQLVEFQIENGVKGILAVGTTGESPTLRLERTQQSHREKYTNSQANDA